MSENNTNISYLETFFQNHELTRREKETAFLLMEGFTNKKIAEKLILSTVTVKSHATNIYRKFKVKSRAEFMAKMYKEKEYLLHIKP